MTDNCRVHDYLVAVALNNIGVTLLERGAFKQSMRTLQDAVFMMKSHLRSSATGGAGVRATPTPVNAGKVQTKLNEAMKRLASAQPVSLALKVNTISFAGSLPSSCIFPFEDQTLPFALAVEIHTVNFDDIKDLDLDLVSGIMLLNFGVAHLCASKVTKSPEKLREGALKLMNMAYSIISFQNDLSQIEQSDTHKISESRFLLAIIILNHIGGILEEVGYHSEAQESKKKLARLGRLICTAADPDFLFKSQSIAPSA